MKKILGLLLLLCFANLLRAQGINLTQGGVDTAGYFIRLPYKNVNDKLIVKVSIEGEQYKFIFDTGALTCVSQKIANRLESISVKEKVGVKDQSGKSDSASLIVLNEIKLDSTRFVNIPALIIEESILFDCFDVDGFIGSNLLHNSIVQFCVEDSTIIITDRIEILKDLDKKYSSKLLLKDNPQYSPFFIMKIGRSKLQVLFDSGSDELVALGIDDFNSLAGSKDFRVLSRITGSSSVGMLGVAENAEEHKLYVPQLTIGSSKLSNAIAQTAVGRSRIGVKLLNYGMVTIDYISGFFYFQPSDPNKPYTNVREKYWTASPNWKDGSLVVGAVWDDLGQPVNQGDKVLAIDGVRCNGITICDLLLRPLIAKDKVEAFITIENKEGIRRNIKIVKQ